MKREIKEQWYIEYEELEFPAVQKGMILTPNRFRELDPFILLAEDWFKRGTFSDHPHRGFQTITYVIDGRLEHIDNKGGYSILEAGDIQYMNAGSGARHAEEAVDDDIAHTLQLWLNLPKALRQTEPSYQNVYVEEAPTVPFEGGSLKVYGGNLHGVSGPLNTWVPMTLSELTLSKNTTFTHRSPANQNAFLIVLSGEVILNERNSIKKSGVVHFTFSELDTEVVEGKISIKAANRSKLLIFTGKPIQEEIVTYGPFVMSSMEEIRQSFRDYHEGKFGEAPAKP